MIFDSTLEIPRYSWKLQRSYMWELALPDIGGISGLFVSTYCQDVKFGDYGMEEVASLKYGAFKAKYAGLLDIPDMNLTFLRPVPDQVTAYFYAWRKLIITDEGFYNTKSNYARSIYFYLYDTTGAITNRIQLVGCFPKDLPAWDFSYESETVSKLSMTINVDRMAFGEFVSPMFEQDTVQPFTRIDLQETASITPQARPYIAPPPRYTVTTGAVPASALSKVTSPGLIPGLVTTLATELGKAVLGKVFAPAPVKVPVTVPKTVPDLGPIAVPELVPRTGPVRVPSIIPDIGTIQWRTPAVPFVSAGPVIGSSVSAPAASAIASKVSGVYDSTKALLSNVATVYSFAKPVVQSLATPFLSVVSPYNPVTSGVAQQTRNYIAGMNTGTPRVNSSTSTMAAGSAALAALGIGALVLAL